jgi:hypothetical protein
LTIYGQEKGTGTLIAGTENGTYTNAGIGAVENTDCGTITINGGKITAYGPSTGHTAIGGANGKGGDAITINGGEIKAYSTDYNAIGLTGAALSKYQICDITINGGTVTAESKTGTAIFGTNVTLGGEAVVNASAGGNVAVIRANDAVTISGGTVTANCTSNAISGIDCTAVTISGGTITTDGAIKGAFTTGEDGSAVILADSISDKTNRESWSGLVCQANEGGIYSTDGTFTLAQDVTIPEKATLTIGEGQTLIVPDGVTLTVYRSSINNGSIKTENGGAIVVQAGANFALADNSSGAAVVDDASLLEEALPGLTFETGGEGGWKTEDSRQTQEDKGGALLALLLGGGIAVGTAIYFYVKSLRVPAEEEAAAEGEATEDRTGEATDEAVPNAAA